MNLFWMFSSQVVSRAAPLVLLPMGTCLAKAENAELNLDAVGLGIPNQIPDQHDEEPAPAVGLGIPNQSPHQHNEEPEPLERSVSLKSLERLHIVRNFLREESLNQSMEHEQACLGSPDEAFKEGEDVVISFPGIHGPAWKAMTRKGFVTTCAWQPRGAPGHADHATWSDGKCYCHYIYGEEKSFGCVWFERWLRKVQVAYDRKCHLIVVVAQKAQREFSLGLSQKGQMAWVREKRMPVRTISVDEFAVEFFGRANGFTHMGRKILEMNASDKIDFTGSESDDFQNTQLAIVSYPGAHGYGWNQLTQGSSALGEHNMATSCIFLPTKDSKGYGEHCDYEGTTGSYNHDFLHRDGCHCDHLYPFPTYRTRPDFGCKWYELWTKKTLEAYGHGCRLIVVTKQDGTLGNSQEGEVRFLKARQMKYQCISIAQFALMLLLTER